MAGDPGGHALRLLAGRTAIPLVAILTAAMACAPGPSGPPRETRSEALDEVALAGVEVGFPGVSIAVGTEDRILTGAAGLADRRQEITMSPAAQVHAASTTKAVTAAAVLMLVDSGSLELDARPAELVADEILRGIPHAADITVRDLLLHTSGLYSPNNDPVYLARYIGSERRERPFWRPEEIVAFAADPANQPLFPPGQGRGYGDINYVLLGLVVEAVDGRTLKSLVRDEILEPLDMRSTWYLSDQPERPRARAYTLDSEILRSIGLDPALGADQDGWIDTTDAQEQSDGAAGLITTTPDLVRFARALALGDLLSEGSRSLVLEVADRARPPDQEVALGVLRAHMQPYGTIVTAEGDGPGTNVVWALHLESRRIVAVAVNSFGRWDESEVILDRLVPRALDSLR